MAELDPHAYGDAGREDAEVRPRRSSTSTKDYFQGLKGYMVEAVLNELEARAASPGTTSRSGGYKIYSTFDKKLMQAAKTAVQPAHAAV